MTVKGVLISKNGDVRATIIKPGDFSTLYKRCGFRIGKGFVKQHTWVVDNKKLAVYGKTKGRATQENKSELPPPIDRVLFFGSMIGVLHNADDSPTDLSVDEWNRLQERLFGGFHDLSKTAMEDDNEEDELKNIDPKNLTRTGYLKDGWIIDDDVGSGLEEEEYRL